MSTNGTGRPSRGELCEMAQALQAEGASAVEIAEILEMGRSSVYELLRWGRSAAHRGRPRLWSRPRIIGAIREYAAREGRPPSMVEWHPALARRKFRDDLADRFYADGSWPSTGTVQAEFGSWNRAIAAAGFTPLRPGHKYVDRERVA